MVTAKLEKVGTEVRSHRHSRLHENSPQAGDAA